MSAELTERELAALAVFPLPNLVFFPGTTLALHLFEPRYREMMADCLRDDRLVIAVAQLKPGWQANYHGRPPLYDIAGAGRVVRHARKRDGTYDIELEGIARVHLHEQPEQRSYRMATAKLLEEAPAEVPRAELPTLLNVAAQVVDLVRKRNPAAPVSLLASPDDEPPRLLDKLADQFVADPALRQRLLEMLDPRQRLRELKRYMAELHLALLAAEDHAGTRTLH